MMQLVETPRDPWAVAEHHWNTEAKENYLLNPGEPRNRPKKFGPYHVNECFPVGPSMSLNADPAACN